MEQSWPHHSLARLVPDTVLEVIPLSDAQQRVFSSVSRLPERQIACERSAGLVLARDVVATENVPPFANTAVDGFAVRSSDVANVPAELRVIGTLAAGDGTVWHVGVGEALRIMTGAPMPW